VRDKAEAIQVKCPLCDHTEIIYIPKEEIPRWIVELLDEGKSY